MARRHFNSFEERVAHFWSLIDQRGPDDCWLWLAGLNEAGYGKCTFPGRSRRAHRMAYELIVGPIPKGMNVCHRCDVPRCCNPQHLFLGTHADNAHDCIAKGRKRVALGEAAGRAKLTTEAVLAIRRSTLPCRVLGAIYGVSNHTVSMIKLKRIWKHVP